MAGRVGGIVRISVDGRSVEAKGDFTWNLGKNKREAVMGTSRAAGYKESPQVAFIEGAVTDIAEIDISSITDVTDATIILELANGKSIVLRSAYYAADGEGTTGEGEFKVRWESPYEAKVIGV